jgi:predicted transcriptional regulator
MSETLQASDQVNIIGLVTRIVAAYVGKNPVRADDLPGLIHTIHDALRSGGVPAEEVRPLTPAVPIRKSIHADHITCLECGTPHKTLKRHLRSGHDLSVDEYRAKWGLPKDYPVVASAYTAVRSALAKRIGLGRRDAVEERDAGSGSSARRGAGGKRSAKKAA